MTLSFSTEINGKPTYFVEKIWAGLGEILTHNQMNEFHIQANLFGHYDYCIGAEKDGPPKITTIREDKADRWKKGNKIHFVIYNRTPDRFQFAPVIPCKGVQVVEIKHHVGHIEVHIDGECFYEVFYHGFFDIYEYTTGLERFVQNDGFDSIEDFFKWFDTDYKGKIIHWTEHRY